MIMWFNCKICDFGSYFLHLFIHRAFYITPINDGHWHHLCLSKQYPKDSLNLFVDSLKGLPDNKAANLVRLFEGREQLILGQRALPNQRLNGSFQGWISETNHPILF